MIDFGPLEYPQPIVDVCVEMVHPGVRLQQFDGRQEAPALQTIFIKAIRHDVARRNQSDPCSKQMLQQLPEDHRIGDVGDEKFIETQHLCLCSEVGRNLFQGVGRAGKISQLMMNTLHEPVKMHSQPFISRQALVEQIHQQRFASTDPTPQIQSSYRCGLTAPEPSTQPACARLANLQHLKKCGKQLHDFALHWVFAESGFCQ